VKSSSYSFSLVVPFQIIASPRYYNESFLAFSSLFYFMSWPFPDNCNVTHSYIDWPCIKFFFHVQPLLKYNQKHNQNMTSILTWNHYQYPFVCTCIVVFWCRLLTLDPIIVPNQPIKRDFSTFNHIFYFQQFIKPYNSCLWAHFTCVMDAPCS
jgi:hypothetical protein